MQYDDMLYDALNQIKKTPRKTVSAVKTIQQPQINFDSLASKIIETLLEKVQERLPAQEININHDTKHLETLITKLQDLIAIPPNINIAPPDNTAIADALLEHGQHMAKLGRLLTQKKCITLSVLRDEDGKMAQIVIEQE